MTWDRREFLYTTSLALVGGAFGRPLFAQDAAPRFEDLRRNVGAFHMRGGTIGWLILQRRPRRRGQPVSGYRRSLPARAQDAQLTDDRRAGEHASPRRSHRGQ